MSQPFVAVVTGSSSGIGRATAIAFAKSNASVVVHGLHNIDGLQTTAELVSQQLPSQGNPPLVVIADVTDDSARRSLVQAVFDRYGYVNAWVHAAGADVLTGPAKHWSFADKLERLWKTDVEGMIHLSRLVAKRMLHQEPTVSPPSMIHIGWDQSSTGMEGDSGQYFCTIKAAVAAFSRSLALSVAPRIRVNGVAPGWIQTEWGKNTSESWNERAIGESMLGRWGRPEDIANAIVWLCGNQAEFVNGQMISVNGGWKSMTLSTRSDSTLE